MKAAVYIEVLPGGELDGISLTYPGTATTVDYGSRHLSDLETPSREDIVRGLRAAAEQLEIKVHKAPEPQEPPRIQSDEGLIVEGSERLGSGVAIPGEVDGHDHKPVQHRDGMPPWCDECGLEAGRNVPRAPRSGSALSRVDGVNDEAPHL